LRYGPELLLVVRLERFEPDAPTLEGYVECQLSSIATMIADMCGANTTALGGRPFVRALAVLARIRDVYVSRSAKLHVRRVVWIASKP
jgi:hypothetical protein